MVHSQHFLGDTRALLEEESEVWDECCGSRAPLRASGYRHHLYTHSRKKSGTEQGSEVQESPFLYTRVERESRQVPRSNWEQVLNAYVGW